MTPPEVPKVGFYRKLILTRGYGKSLLNQLSAAEIKDCISSGSPCTNVLKTMLMLRLDISVPEVSKVRVCTLDDVG